MDDPHSGRDLVPRVVLSAPAASQVHVLNVVILVVSILSIVGAGWIVLSFCVSYFILSFRRILFNWLWICSCSSKSALFGISWFSGSLYRISGWQSTFFRHVQWISQGNCFPNRHKRSFVVLMASWHSSLLCRVSYVSYTDKLLNDRHWADHSAKRTIGSC